MSEARTGDTGVYTYRTPAKPEREKSHAEHVLEEIAGNPVKKKQVTLYLLWRDVLLFIGVMFLFVECLGVSALFVYGMVNPMVSLVGSIIFAMLITIPSGFVLLFGVVDSFLYVCEQATQKIKTLFGKVLPFFGIDFLFGSKRTYVDYVYYSKVVAIERERREKQEIQEYDEEEC